MRVFLTLLAFTFSGAVHAAQPQAAKEDPYLKRFQELERLRSVPIFVGGRSIVNYQSLARSHGLLPVTGPIDKSADLFVVEFEHWSRSAGAQR